MRIILNGWTRVEPLRRDSKNERNKAYGYEESEALGNVPAASGAHVEAKREVSVADGRRNLR